MKVLFIAHGIDVSNGVVNISGGDVRWISVAKVWKESGIEVHVLTQKAGLELCKQLNLEAIFHVLPTGSGTGIIDYVDRVVNSFNIPDDLKHFHGLIYSTTELLYDVLPGALIRARNRRSRLAVVAHHVIPIKRPGVPYVNSILFYLNDRMGYFISKRKADVILAVSNPTKEDIVKKIRIPKEKVETVACGVDYAGIRKMESPTENGFDGVFIGRFAKEKGIFDLVEIWKSVCKVNPNARLAIIGSGSVRIEDELKGRIGKEGLENNIVLLGRISDFHRKNSILRSSKIFVLPSYGENWGIVIGEALACGLPVVAYDLPKIRPVWGDNVSWIPIGNRDIFASTVAHLLDDNDSRNVISEKGVDFVRRYDWSVVAMDDLELIKKVWPEWNGDIDE